MLESMKEVVYLYGDLTGRLYVSAPDGREREKSVPTPKSSPLQSEARDAAFVDLIPESKRLAEPN